MRIGNVIRSPEGDLWIVTNVREDLIDAVSFDMENCSATQKRKLYHTRRPCDDCAFDGGADIDCPTCGGSGTMLVAHQGWDRAKVLAPTVQEFIMNGVKAAWKLR